MKKIGNTILDNDIKKPNSKDEHNTWQNFA